MSQFDLKLRYNGFFKFEKILNWYIFKPTVNLRLIYSHGKP